MNTNSVLTYLNNAKITCPECDKVKWEKQSAHTISCKGCKPCKGCKKVKTYGYVTMSTDNECAAIGIKFDRGCQMRFIPYGYIQMEDGKHVLFSAE